MMQILHCKVLITNYLAVFHSMGYNTAEVEKCSRDSADDKNRLLTKKSKTLTRLTANEALSCTQHGDVNRITGMVLNLTSNISAPELSRMRRKFDNFQSTC
jgi:hypothetical protein